MEKTDPLEAHTKSPTDYGKLYVLSRAVNINRRGIVLITNTLVAIDGSEKTGRILDFALDLTKKYKASITILNENAEFGGSFDLIILGHNAQNKMSERVLGGVTEKVVNYASCLIMMVNQEFR